MYIDFLYAVEEVDRGIRRFAFAIEDGPRTPIRGLPGSVEFFDHYCELVAAHGLSIEGSFAPVSAKDARSGRGYPSFGGERKRARRLQAEVEAKRACRDEPPPPIIVPPNNIPREKARRPPDSTGEPPRRRTRGPARFREKDVTRAIRGAMRAKIEIAAIKIEPDGSILVIPGTPEAVATSDGDLDRELEEFERRHADD
jgi:hypothetical protein